MNFARSAGARPTAAAAKKQASAAAAAVSLAPPSRKPALPQQKSSSRPAASARGRDFDDDASLDDSMDDAWMAEVSERQAFLEGLGAGGANAAAVAAEASSAAAQPSVRPSAAAGLRESGGLDDADAAPLGSSFAAVPSPSSSSSAHPPVPTLFELAVEQLGLQFAAIASQDIQQRLPSGTLRAAILAVRKAEKMGDAHLPLLMRTLANEANQVSSRSWLEKDCGLDALVSSSLEAEENEADSATAPAPSKSPPPAAAAAPASAPKPRAAPKPAASLSSAATANARFAPLRGTPGVAPTGHSMNTATLARQAKAQKLAAQIAASNVQPHAKPNVKAQVAQVKSQLPMRSASTAQQLLSVGSVLPREYIIASGELLDLHAQHRLSEGGFKTLAALMEYTAARAQNPGAVDTATAAAAQEKQRIEASFTEEQRARLASVGISSDLRALVRSVAPAHAASSVTSAFSSSSLSIPDLIARAGIWRPVHIVNLDLSFTAITSSALGVLAKQMPRLLKINICGCESLTGSGIADLVVRCPLLQVVLMEVLPCLSDAAVQDVVHGLKSLLSLDVGSCKKLTNVSFQIIGTHGKTLKRLSVAGCANLNDFDIEDLSRCVSLQSLSLRACTKITDASIESLVLLAKRKKKANMRGLAHLDLGGCGRISDGGVNALVAAYGSSLTHLDLRGNGRITNRALDAIQAHAKLLRQLTIVECAGITAERIEALRESCPTLELVA